MRIVGINIPDSKRIEASLTYIYGLGHFSAKKILNDAKINPNIRTSKLNPAQINSLKDIIEKKYKIEGELRRDISFNIKRLKEIGAYRGIRHMKGLPVRGQRTKTNSRTRRGNVRKTVGSGRKPPVSPT